ncbi:MAG: helicase-associated domain-containing protein, partial [Acidimicrobiales bacterium]
SDCRALGVEVDHDRGVPQSLGDYARCVPLNTLSAFGFGPLARDGRDPVGALDGLRRSDNGAWAAVETVGVTGQRLLRVLAALGGRASAEQLAFQTTRAAAGVVEEALGRLRRAELVLDDGDGIALAPWVAQRIAGVTLSFAEHQAMTSDVLATICANLGVSPVPTRKHERLAAATRALADEASRARLRAELSAEAQALLGRIVDAAGSATASPRRLGLDYRDLLGGAVPRYGGVHQPSTPAGAALRELTWRGIVGVSEWEDAIWVWREAWPFVARPFVADWRTAPEPARVPAGAGLGAGLPPIVAALNQALELWRAHAPGVLKTDEPRLAKAEVRSTAKRIGSSEETVELASRLAIGIGLLLPNEIGRSGRGLRVSVQRVWLADPMMADAWRELAPLQRWARLVAEWCTPSVSCGQQLLVNRHLVIWELLALPEGCGYADREQFANWFADRYASLGRPDAALECLADLEALGVIGPGPAALTPLGRRVLDDPAAAAEAGSGASGAYVQADLTVVAPPDLRHDLLARLDAIARLENASGALTYRLDATRITQAVQRGQRADEVLGLLAELASAPLPDTVTRLVRDAAARAGAVQVLRAATVVVVRDPQDLVAACSLKALRLTPVSDTVAVTDVALAKVHAALERKGLTPETLAGGAAASARSSADEAACAAARAAELRTLSAGRSHRAFERHAEELEAQAAALTDVAGRLRASGPLTVTPTLLERLEPAVRA